MKNICPKCKSNNIKIVDYLGTKCIICKACNYDATNQYDVYPEQKTSQKEKGRHTPYKTGGHKRSRK